MTLKAILMEGNQLKQEGKIDQAIEKYSSALQVNPKYFSALNELAEIYVQENQYNKALSLYRAAIKEEPVNGMAYAKLAWVMFQQGQVQDAIIYCEKALNYLENPPSIIYRQLGDIFYRNGQVNRAIDLHQQAFKDQFKKANFYLNNYWVNHNHKIVFCAIPKNANSLFSQMLVDHSKYYSHYCQEKQNYEEARQGRHKINLGIYFRNNPKIKEDFLIKHSSYLHNQEYFKFVILRNPFKRLVSGYKNKFVNTVIRTKKRKKKVSPTINPETIIGQEIRKVADCLGIQPDFEKSITFEQFVHYLVKNEDIDLNQHWRPQHTFLGFGLFKFEFDFIGQFEKLDLVIEHLETRFNIKVNTDIKKKDFKTNYRDFSNQEKFCDKYPEYFLGSDGFPSSHQFYTPELEELVRVRYAQDIDLYERNFNVTPRP